VETDAFTVDPSTSVRHVLAKDISPGVFIPGRARHNRVHLNRLGDFASLRHVALAPRRRYHCVRDRCRARGGVKRNPVNPLRSSPRRRRNPLTAISRGRYVVRVYPRWPRCPSRRVVVSLVAGQPAQTAFGPRVGRRLSCADRRHRNARESHRRRRTAPGPERVGTSAPAVSRPGPEPVPGPRERRGRSCCQMGLGPNFRPDRTGPAS